MNVGLGAGGYGYRFKQLRTGQAVGSRPGSGFAAIDVLVGRRLTGPVHVKGGFTFGFARGLHAFQPLLLIALKH